MKKLLYQHCLSLVENKIDRLKTAIGDLSEAAKNESKSSAGDKYETGLEMLQQEREKYKVQLRAVLLQQKTLANINPTVSKNTVELGSFVKTNHGTFFMSIGVGKVVLDDQNYFVISLSSPIGQILKDKKAGEKAVFNGRTYVLEEVT